MARYLVLLFLATALCCAGAKQFSRCELARALRTRGFTDLNNWVCLVESESGRSTSAVGPPNKNGSRDYGLFQINSKYWCGKDKKGGDCNIKCSDLTNDNIDDDCTCAKKIFKRQGFSAWYGWQKKCKGKKLPDVSKC